RAAGPATARLGGLLALEGHLSFQERKLRLSDLRATSDLALAAPAAGVQGPVKGRAEIADGEVTWVPERGGWPDARVTLNLLDTALPASAVGVDVRTPGVEARLALGARHASVRARP